MITVQLLPNQAQIIQTFICHDQWSRFWLCAAMLAQVIKISFNIKAQHFFLKNWNMSSVYYVEAFPRCSALVHDALARKVQEFSTEVLCALNICTWCCSFGAVSCLCCRAVSHWHIFVSSNLQRQNNSNLSIVFWLALLQHQLTSTSWCTYYTQITICFSTKHFLSDV